MKIIGQSEKKNVLEYVLNCSQEDSTEQIRSQVFESLKKSFLKDYESFHITRGNWLSKVASNGRDSNFLAIEDPFKGNLSANVRVENTLYPEFKILKVFSQNLDAIETLYGGTVRQYIDKRVRKAIS